MWSAAVWMMDFELVLNRGFESNNNKEKNVCLFSTFHSIKCLPFRIIFSLVTGLTQCQKNYMLQSLKNKRNRFQFYSPLPRLQYLLQPFLFCVICILSRTGMGLEVAIEMHFLLNKHHKC